jgi:hypothetical protein
MNSSSHQKKRGSHAPAASTPLNVGTSVRGLIQLGPDSQHNFSVLGREYLEAAITLSINRPQDLHWPTFFLVCQALELYLKAFLRSRDVPVGDLRNPRVFGHDLQLGFNKAMQLGLHKALPIAGELGKCIAIISTPYKKRDFQYMHSWSGELIFLPALILLVKQTGQRLEW